MRAGSAGFNFFFFFFFFFFPCVLLAADVAVRG